MMDNKGQLSAEYLLLAGVLIILVMLAIVFVASENELNMAMSAARNGAIEGIGTSSLALYPIDMNIQIQRVVCCIHIRLILLM